MFSSSRTRRSLEPIAAEFGVRAFRLPMDVQALGRLLDEVARGATA